MAATTKKENHDYLSQEQRQQMRRQAGVPEPAATNDTRHMSEADRRQLEMGGDEGEEGEGDEHPSEGLRRHLNKPK